MITTTKVQATKYYSKMDGLGKKMILNKTSMEHIKLGFNMSNLTSYENWLKVCSPRDKIKGIVSELLKGK
jgi:hypothetical protein